MPIITSKIKPDSIVYTDSYRSYNALDVSDFKHFRINHSKELADHHNHINIIANFWSQAKRVLRKYNGIDKKNFHLFIKEYEFRFNLWCTILGSLKLWRSGVEFRAYLVQPHLFYHYDINQDGLKDYIIGANPHANDIKYNNATDLYNLYSS